MSKPIVLITHRFDHHVLLKAQRENQCAFHYEPELFKKPELLKQARGLILRSGLRVNEDVLQKLPQLEVLVTATSGFDHLDLKALQKKGVRVFHVPEAQSVAAAELTLLHILASQRQLSLAQEQVRSGRWERFLLQGRELQGQQLGVIGYGRVGRAVTARALAFGLEVSVFDPFVTEQDPLVPWLGFEELMRSSDIVTLHVPLTPKTRHMIQATTLAWMGPEATLINLSRGEVVNEDDLVHHLRKHPQFKVGLDVFEQEPLSKDSPLMGLANVQLSPHIGASTGEAMAKASQGAVDKVHAYFAGKAVIEGQLPPQVPWYEG